MKLYVVFLILVMMPFAYGIKTGALVDVQGDIYKGCVEINQGDSAYDLLKEFDAMGDGIDITFDGVITGTPFLRAVNGVEGESLGDNRFSGWNFWISDNDNSFQEPPELAPGWGMGIGDYEVENEIDVIGINFGVTEFNSDWTVKTKPEEPSYVKYSNLCEKLNVKDIKAYVDGKKESGADEDGGKIDVLPGSKLELKIELENLYTDDEDTDINDILVEGTIEDIDYGDDLEDDHNEFDLKADDKKNVVLKFDIPLNVEEDDYDLTIKISGEDESFRILYSETIEFEVEVDKEKHDLVFNKISLDDDVVCGSSFKLILELVNLGAKEENVELTISNEDLELNKVESFKLETGNSYNKNYLLFMPENKAGKFPITISVVYDDRNSREIEVKEINVECETSYIAENVETKSVSGEEKTNIASFAVAQPLSETIEAKKDVKKSSIEKRGVIITIALVNLFILLLFGFLALKFLI